MIYAIVVTFNPEPELLAKQYESLKNQVNGIIYVDNASYVLTIPSGENVYSIRNEENQGLAIAQNKGIELAKQKNAEFVFLLDQDSVLPIGMVDTLRKEFEHLKCDNINVGAIGPVIHSAYTSTDAKTVVSLGFKLKQADVMSTMETSYIIASGTLIPMGVIDEVGGLCEKLFIDGLDLEWCIRAKSKGYKIYITSKTKLTHQLGNGNKNKILSHSPQREYYIVRNDVWISKQQYIPWGYRFRKTLTPVCRLAMSICSGKLKYAKSDIKGLLDGIRL